MQVRRYVAVQQSANPRKVGLLVMLWATHGPTGLHHSDPKLIDRAIWPYTKGKSFVESAPIRHRIVMEERPRPPLANFFSAPDYSVLLRSLILLSG